MALGRNGAQNYYDFEYSTLANISFYEMTILKSLRLRISYVLLYSLRNVLRNFPQNSFRKFVIEKKFNLIFRHENWH